MIKERFRELSEYVSRDLDRAPAFSWNAKVTVHRRFTADSNDKTVSMPPNDKLRRWAARPENHPADEWKNETDNPFTPPGE